MKLLRPKTLAAKLIEVLAGDSWLLAFISFKNGRGILAKALQSLDRAIKVCKILVHDRDGYLK